MSDSNLKDLILLNATTLFADNGFSKTSLQKIADASNTSQTNVLYHFKTKKLLFESCLFKAIKKNRSILKVRKFDSDKEALLFLLDTNIQWATHFPKDCQLFLLLFYFASNDDYFQKLTAKITFEGKILLKSYVDKLDLNESFSSEQAVSLLQNYIHGVMFNIIAQKDPKIVCSYKESINSLIGHIFK